MKRATGVKKVRKATRKNNQNKKTISLSAVAEEEPKRRSFSLPERMEWYKPLKKAVTLRLDADVLAWFKKSGSGYQTRINGALRKLMKEEMKEDKKAPGE
jgi:uncharacterized protein (DUF4415 family)